MADTSIDDADIASIPLIDNVASLDNPPAGKFRFYILNGELILVSSTGEAADIGGSSPITNYQLFK